MPGSSVENHAFIVPQNMFDAVKENKKIFVRIPRTFSGNNLGWYLSYFLIRTQINDKQVLPIVIEGKDIVPPQKSLNRLSPNFAMDEKVNSDLYEKIYIIEEPVFSSKTRMDFLSQQIKSLDGYIIIVSKTEDRIATISNFIQENSLIEYTICPISFSETAIFLEKNFDMQPFEAEAVALRLDNTFRKFRIEVDPSYFTLIGQDTLLALIDANKRAELIQLAVHGLLSLIVAYDPASTSLSRSTRERFLKKICLHKIKLEESFIEDTDLSALALEFIHEYGFKIDQSEFLSPFFKSGLLYNCHGKVSFAYPYLESYLIAKVLRDYPDIAVKYFNPERRDFDVYSFDLYCEMGPGKDVVDSISRYSDFFVNAGQEKYGKESIFIKNKKVIDSSVVDIGFVDIIKRISEMADKLENADNSKNIRDEKQRILDTQSKVIGSLSQRNSSKDSELEDEIQVEFFILDGLSRASILCLTLLGSGSESINKHIKEDLLKTSIDTCSIFMDIWMYNRMRIDFKDIKNSLLSDTNISAFVKSINADESSIEKIRKDLATFLAFFQSNVLMEPINRVLSNLCGIAGVPVLSPIISHYKATDINAKILQSIWLLEASPDQGFQYIKSVFQNYNGASLLRVAISRFLLDRLYWQHYQTDNSRFFANAVKQVIKRTGLQYEEKTLKEAIQGPVDA
ncbi:Hypothetical protein APO_1683 [Acetobacter pomorum DM001]|uniref:Uncharacterized protein n=1 Tax=Acetobacter pomorum DM001 TaxID=945681 RepID=F1YUQ9_9PROT|nr:Hypothetical protein APO_1683 [Acetobacter pomorum DM001]